MVKAWKGRNSFENLNESRKETKKDILDFYLSARNPDSSWLTVISRQFEQFRGGQLHDGHSDRPAGAGAASD